MPKKAAVKYSILTLVFNRDPLVLMNTFRALSENDLRECEIVVVDDGSSLDYGALIAQWSSGVVPFRWVRVDTAKDRPGTYTIDGHNNPAYAWNRALAEARGENVVLLSSDCMPQAWSLSKIKALTSLKRVMWHPAVFDLGLTTRSGMSGNEFNGVTRLAPLGWMLATAKKNIIDAGGWDEEYLKGIAFEDNDFAARLALHTGRVVIDPTVTVWHQSHPDMAYSDERKGWNTNRDYTNTKWGGIPWIPKLGCPMVYRQNEINEQVVVDVSLRDEKKAS